MWQPRFSITAEIARALVAIEGDRVRVEQQVWSPRVEEEIRHRARLRATHYSTSIEGNRLTLAEAADVVSGRNVVFAGRERDVREVDNYWHALLQVEDWAQAGIPVSEDNIRRLHAIVEYGRRRRPTPYRTAQNVIREGGSGSIIYLPPQPSDVPKFMRELVDWVADAEGSQLSSSIIAALAHYQFVTIHPFMDGNGRTARLVATWLLHRGGYGLRGFYSLEEYHARDLAGYYGELATHVHHNFYEGRENTDLTRWVEYFVKGVAHVFHIAREEALRYAARGLPPEPEMVRRLDQRARRVLALFGTRAEIAAADVRSILPLGERMVRNLLTRWVDDGLLVVLDSSNRARAYGLSPKYRQYMKALSAARPGALSRPTGSDDD